MRTKIELVLVALVIAMTLNLAYAEQEYKCGGSYNCKLVNCYDAAAEGYSCGLVTAVVHKKCEFTGDKMDDCKSMPTNSAQVKYYTGGPCDNNNAPYCGGFFTGATKTLLQEGCNK